MALKGLVSVIDLKTIIPIQKCPAGCSICLCHQKIQPKPGGAVRIQHPDVPNHKVENVKTKSVRLSKSVGQTQMISDEISNLLKGQSGLGGMVGGGFTGGQF